MAKQHMTHLMFQLVAGLYIVGLSHVFILRLWQAVPVSFPIGQSGKLIQQDKGLGDHVFRQELASMLPQLGDVCAAG